MTLTTLPAYAFATSDVELAAARVTGLPRWSGKGEPPAIGQEVTCNDKPLTRVTVTGYAIEGGWLMVEGFRTADPSKRGTLAGAEILWPKS